MSYTTADITAAIARANGQPLKRIKVGAFNDSSATDLGPLRNVAPKGTSPYEKGMGHTFAHVDTFAEGSIDAKVIAGAALAKAQKSRWQDRRTAIAAATEMMNSPQAQAGIQSFTGGGPAPASPVWLQHIPLVGIYYGYEAGQSVPRLVEKGSINFYIVDLALFIYSCYPNDFIAGAIGLRDDACDLAGLFD